MEVLTNYRETWATIRRRSENKSEKRKSEKLSLLQETLKIFQNVFP